MNCNQFAKYITDYVDGTLDRGVAGDVEIHMSICRDCSSLVTELENTSSLIRSLDRLTAPQGFEQALKARIASGPDRAPRASPGRRLFGWLVGPARRPLILRPVYAALLICLVFVGSMFVQKTYFAQPDMDWEYLGKLQAQHASYASANPLADDSAIILTERARDLGEEL